MVWGIEAMVLEHPVSGRPLIAYSDVADGPMPRARAGTMGHAEA